MSNELDGGLTAEHRPRTSPAAPTASPAASSGPSSATSRHDGLPTGGSTAACRDALAALGLDWPDDPGSALAVHSPIDGARMGRIGRTPREECARRVAAATRAQQDWCQVPAPVRGELIRRLGERLRQAKPALGRLVSLETGKLLQEGLGEVQEMIDICDFALGLSRQLHGLVIASERPGHKMLESWHPFGTCAIISAFNFPVAVWAWNAALAVVCGNSVVWKPSEKAPLSAWATHALFREVLAEHAPEHREISQLLIGERELGEFLVDHPGVRLISATGSTAMGRAVGLACARHFKRSILELGGNNAAVVTPSADLDLALRAVTFAAVGTAGQRCTSLRRLFVHVSRHDEFVERLKRVYRSLPVGDPLEADTLVGPLIDQAAYDRMQTVLQAVGSSRVTGGERELADRFPQAWYVRPAIVELKAQQGPMLEETFAPILYVTPYRELEEAIAFNNASAHGLSSCIFTTDLREAEFFLANSDCGIANVNIGTSGAEIGGAFGGEKETGGGRESGSDAWKNYMRRATNTINYSRTLPLAQGIRFEIDDQPSSGTVTPST